MLVGDEWIKQPMHHINGAGYTANQGIVEVTAAEAASENGATLVFNHVIYGVVGRNHNKCSRFLLIL
jgi:hypothetical protein